MAWISLQTYHSLPYPKPAFMGKQHRDSVPKKASTRASQILQLVHSDVHGPLKVDTPWGFKYWITYIDDKSHFMSHENQEPGTGDIHAVQGIGVEPDWKDYKDTER